MARHESDREDLLREATGLVERIELAVTEFEQPVVVGCRRSGCMSIYFGADPVVQFNTRREFRRGYRGGRLLKAERGEIVELTRQRAAASTLLVRRDLPKQEQQALLAELAAYVARLRQALRTGSYRVTGQVPADGHVIASVQERLDQLPEPWQVAQRAGAE